MTDLVDPDAPSIRLIDDRRMQCKDIPDDAFLAAVRRTPGTSACNWRMRWNVQAALEQELGPIPENLFLAKARRLMDRGLLGGCDCGCRGDYHPADECYDQHCCGRRAPGVPTRMGAGVLTTGTSAT